MKILAYIAVLCFLTCVFVNDFAQIKLTRCKAVITGNVKNFTDSTKALRFIVTNAVVDINKFAYLNPLGNFRLEIELFNPQDILLSYGNSGATFFLHPGDSLHLNLDAEKFKNTAYPYYEISGINSATSKNIRDYLISHTPFTNDYNFNPNYDKPIDEFLSDIKIKLAIEDSVLNEFNKQNIPTEEFLNWARNDVLYLSFSIWWNYFTYSDMNHKEYKSEIFNTELFPREDKAISNWAYIWFLSQYPVMKYSASDSIALHLLKEKEFRNSFARSFDNLLKSESSGLSRDIMIYKIFDNFFEGRIPCSVDDANALYDKYKIYIKDHELNTTLLNRMYKFAHKEDSIVSLLDLKTGTKSEKLSKFWDMLAAKHKDKVICIDIWGTWCGACRSEIPFTVDFFNNYKDKPAALVTICCHSTRDEWEKFLPQLGKVSDNYFFNEDEASYLQDELKLDGYPKHLVINKKGEVVKVDAVSFSSDEFRGLLNKLVSE